MAWDTPGPPLLRRSDLRRPDPPAPRAARSGSQGARSARPPQGVDGRKRCATITRVGSETDAEVVAATHLPAALHRALRLLNAIKATPGIA
jgi:hypothetical protein